MEDIIFCLLSLVKGIVSDCNKTSLKETEMICETNREMNETKCKTAAVIAVVACATVAGSVRGAAKIISGEKNKDTFKSIDETKHMEDGRC